MYPVMRTPLKINNSLNWLIGGAQGSGVDSAANIFSRACAEGGLYIILKDAILLIGILLLLLVPLDLSIYTSGQSAFAQDTNTSIILPPPVPFDELSAQQIATSTNKTCTLTPSLIEVEGTPQEIEGPYFVDDLPNRSDIRSDASEDGSIQEEEGIPLQLIIHVYDIRDNSSCIPFSGAKVDIWHANSQGIYSGIAEQGTEGKNFLRGYQIADDNGTVQFTTIYPGWYEGRAIHIHVKVRSMEGLQDPFEWTSQFYLNNSINEEVHKKLPYSNHGPVEMLNEEDGIYTGPSTDGLIQTNSGDHLMLNLTNDQQEGYIGTFNIGVNATRSEK
jgi:protocatechuate 3,4-dioxygenase beta subunit